MPSVPARERVGRVRRSVLAAESAPIFGVLLVVYLVAAVLVSVQSQQTLLSTDALDSILTRSVGLGIVAAGQTIAIIVGSIDLSVAYLISVAATYSSAIMQGDPNKVLVGLVIVLGAGVAVGIANGLIITKLRVNAFIATLGMAFILSGILNASFQDFAGSVPTSFQDLAYGEIGPIRTPFVLLGGVLIFTWLLLRYSRLGHHMYAVGGSEETARLSGVRSHRVIIAAHVLCSVTAILTGLFIVARIKAGAPWVGPDSHYDLDSIAAVVVGGTALSGGRGGVWGTFAGVLILSVLDTTFNSLQFNGFLQNVARGVIIIGAVGVYALRAHRNRA